MWTHERITELTVYKDGMFLDKHIESRLFQLLQASNLTRESLVEKKLLFRKRH